MKLEIVEYLSLGNSKINHIKENKTDIVDLQKKGEVKWNAILQYVNNYCDNYGFTIKEIENGKIWLIKE